MVCWSFTQQREVQSHHHHHHHSNSPLGVVTANSPAAILTINCSPRIAYMPQLTRGTAVPQSAGSKIRTKDSDRPTVSILTNTAVFRINQTLSYLAKSGHCGGVEATEDLEGRVDGWDGWDGWDGLYVDSKMRRVKNVGCFL